MTKIYSDIVVYYAEKKDPMIKSLIKLVDIFFQRIVKEYVMLTNEEKISLIQETFYNRTLKQNMEFVDSMIVVSTVHGAKGLEWPYVFLPDMEQFVFPNNSSLCGDCHVTDRFSGTICKVSIDSKRFEAKFLDVLRIFYVAVTRARNCVYFSASKKHYNWGRNSVDGKISCLLNLPGIKIS